MKLCYIVGAAPAGFAVPPRREDFVIAADGGYSALQRLGVTPDLLLGDFDSLGTPPQGLPVLRFPVEKDDTDSALAVKTGLKHGCDAFLLEGCLGGQLDHSLANLSLLAALAEAGIPAYALEQNRAVTALCRGTLRFPPEAAGRISVLSHSDVSRGVTLTGLYYPLSGAVLTRQTPLGVSNCFTGAAASVTVEEGTLLVYSAWRNFPFLLDLCRETL